MSAQVSREQLFRQIDELISNLTGSRDGPPNEPAQGLEKCLDSLHFLQDFLKNGCLVCEVLRQTTKNEMADVVQSHVERDPGLQKPIRLPHSFRWDHDLAAAYEQGYVDGEAENIRNIKKSLHVTHTHDAYHDSVNRLVSRLTACLSSVKTVELDNALQDRQIEEAITIYEDLLRETPTRIEETPPLAVQSFTSEFLDEFMAANDWCKDGIRITSPDVYAPRMKENGVITIVDGVLQTTGIEYDTKLYAFFRQKYDNYFEYIGDFHIKGPAIMPPEVWKSYAEDVGLSERMKMQCGLVDYENSDFLKRKGLSISLTGSFDQQVKQYLALFEKTDEPCLRASSLPCVFRSFDQQKYDALHAAYIEYKKVQPRQPSTAVNKKVAQSRSASLDLARASVAAVFSSFINQQQEEEDLYNATPPPPLPTRQPHALTKSALAVLPQSKQ